MFVTTDLGGLTEEEARRRLAAFGPNDLPARKRRGVLAIVVETLRQPMFLLLLASTVLYMSLGDLLEGVFLMGGAVAAIALVVVQEARSERALAALNRLAQPKARVLREGEARTIPARDLAPGDLVLLGEGERAPADALLIAGDVLTVDESALTGESAPVTKRIASEGEAFAPEAPTASDVTPFIFGGALVVRGQGLARVARTGPRSELGKIGRVLGEIRQQRTPLQVSADRIAGVAGACAIAFCGVVVLAYGLLRHEWIKGVLAGLTLAMGLIPEEFPMVLAVFLALAAWRMAGRRVLVRRAAAIEALGGVTVLCVDKTGTITCNRMEVACLMTPDGRWMVPPDGHVEGAPLGLLEVAALASAPHPVDPMDRAVHRLIDASHPGWTTAHGQGPRRAWPLRAQLLAVVNDWPGEASARLAAKGAPEAIWRLCRLAPGEIETLEAATRDLAEDGMRVLAVASAASDVAPDEPLDLPFRFEGLVGFRDPVRVDAPAAIREAQAAGVRVLMITGDHPATAQAVARSIGLDVTAGPLTGTELARLSPQELSARLGDTQVFARISPEQKLRIVEGLKARGEIVAMTGDGVNDAPALEAAHIGLAMGERGADVARETADLVILDDSFASIVAGIRLGRRTFANLRRALVYVVAIHVPLAGVALAPILLGLPPLLFPMHVLLLELATDPICALVFEAEPSEAEAMASPPRPPGESVFGARQLWLALAQGLAVFAAVLGVYAWAQGRFPEVEARGAGLLTLVMANVALAMANAISGRNALFAVRRPTFWLITLAVAAIMGLVFSIPQARLVFRVTWPPAYLLAAALGAVAASVGLAAALRGLAERRRPADFSRAA